MNPTPNDTPQRGFTGLWIPAFIVLDERLTLLEKMLYAEVDALDKGNENKGCYASNEYLAEIMGAKERTITESFTRLKRFGLIRQTAFNGRQRILKVVNMDGDSCPIRVAEKCESNSRISATSLAEIRYSDSLKSASPVYRGSSREKSRDKRVVATLDKSSPTRRAYPWIAEAIKAQASEQVRDEFFGNYHRWMKYFKDAQPTLEQLIEKIENDLLAKID